MEKLTESVLKDVLFPVLTDESLVRIGLTNRFFNRITKSQIIRRLEAPLKIIIPNEECLFLLKGGYAFISSPGVDAKPDIMFDIEEIVASDNHAILLKKDRSVFVWGSNQFGQIGLIDKKEIPVHSPVMVPELTNIKIITAATNTYHSVFVTEERTVWICGSNSCGYPGLWWSREKKSHPILIPGLTGVKAVAAGLFHTLFLMEDGTVRACGSNARGQLGLGSNQVGVVPEPFSIPGLTGVKSIIANEEHSLFLKEDGTVWICGSNEFGQLGLPDRGCKYIPQPISDLKGVKSIATSKTHSLFIMEDGTVLVCGSNQFGQIGLGNQKTTSGIVPIPELTNIKNVSTNKHQTVFFKEDGSLWVCGMCLEKFFKNIEVANIANPTKSTAFSWEKDLKRLKDLKEEVEQSSMKSPHP